MIFVSSCPALPTNGSPCRSSSSPGASPTNINSASGLPTPKTTCVRDFTRCGHFVQASTGPRIAASRSALVPSRRDRDPGSARWQRRWRRSASDAAGFRRRFASRARLCGSSVGSTALACMSRSRASDSAEGAQFHALLVQVAQGGVDDIEGGLKFAHGRLRWDASFHEVGRDRRLEIHSLAGARMREAEPPRVQHLPGKPAALAIDFIAEQRMAEVLEMDANLVRAAGVQRAFDERPVRQVRQARDSSVFAARPRPVGDHRHLLALHRMAADRRLDDRRFSAPTSPRPARDKSSSLRARQTAAPAPDARRRFSPRRGSRWFPCRADARCPAAARRRCRRAPGNGAAAH